MEFDSKRDLNMHTRIAHPAEWHSILEVDDGRVETIDTDTGDMRPVAVVRSVEQRWDK